jgi:hypothetical protein
MQERHGRDRVDVLLLSMDGNSRSRDLEECREGTRRICEKLKVDWTNVFAPDDWSGVLRTFNAKSYGMILVDPGGTVRGANLHVSEVESLLQEIQAEGGFRQPQSGGRLDGGAKSPPAR